ncbi:MAG: glycosyltransferase [Candidatus Rokuibacteriota bacterium]|nr:MAG: glycosyltransferase [Candidatus Rokubacteria bacterium]
MTSKTSGVADDASAVSRRGAADFERTDVFGVRCFRGTLNEATALLIDAAVARSGGYACLCNVHVLETARRDPNVMHALAAAEVVFPDGAPIALAQRWFAPVRAERVGGPDLMQRVIADGQKSELRHAFYGSTPTVLASLERSLRDRYPDVNVVASVAPPFGPRVTLSEADREMMRAARPHIVWVALGAPRQELWMARHAAQLAPSMLVGVGAAFDFLSGSKVRAPRWMQTAGLEWLHRLLSEPRRLGPRYVTTNARFLGRLARSVLNGNARRKPCS